MASDATTAAAALAFVMETAPVLALSLDERQHVVSVNAHARRILGAGVVGRPLAAWVVDFEKTMDLRALTAQRDSLHMLSLKTAAGLPESYFFQFFPLATGTLALGSLDAQEQEHLRREVLGLNRDLNNLTRQLHQANAELRDLNQLKNQFLGMAAHDLRRPIGVIMTYGEFVLDEAGERLTAEHREFLQTCLAAAANMKRLIDDFLDVAVIESGQLRLDLAPTSVEEMVAGAVKMARLAATRKNISLLVESVGAPLRLVADASKLQQALLNLLGNAVEHSQPGQRVWLASCWQPSELLLSVRDEGPGLAPEEQARLFAPFARAGTRKTAGERSIGLGLAITRQIVEAHGGRLWVQSVPGQGATFFLALPAPTSQLNPTTEKIL